MRLGISHVTPHETPEQWAAEQRALRLSAVVFPVDYTAPDSVIAAYADACKKQRSAHRGGRRVEQPRGRKRRRAPGRAAKVQRPAAPGGRSWARAVNIAGGVSPAAAGTASTAPPTTPRGLRGHGRFHPRHPRRRPPDAHGLLHGGHAVDDPPIPRSSTST